MIKVNVLIHQKYPRKFILFSTIKKVQAWSSQAQTVLEDQACYSLSFFFSLLYFHCV